MLTQEHKQYLRQYLNLVRQAAVRPEAHLNHDTLWVKVHLKQANQLRAAMGKNTMNMEEFRNAVSCFRQLEGIDG
jgi:hypothetical protein